MYRTRPEDLPEFKIIDLTPGRLVIIIATVFLFFVVPVSVITYFKNNPRPQTEASQSKTDTSGKVAGVQTTNETTIPFTNMKMDLSSEGGVAITVGFILVGLSIILIIFLIIDNIRYKKITSK